jgi:hypothetical protein
MKVSFVAVIALRRAIRDRGAGRRRWSILNLPDWLPIPRIGG